MTLGSTFAGIGGFVYIYSMANQYTAREIPSKQEIETLYFDKNMTQAEVGDHYGVSQKVVFSWFRKLKITSRVAAKRDQLGEKNHQWKGRKASYAAFHYRVQKRRGKPSDCEWCGTKSAKRYEWANMSGNFHDINDYVRLCASCHRKHDYRCRKNKK